MNRRSSRFSPTTFSRVIAPAILIALVLGLLAAIAITLAASFGLF